MNKLDKIKPFINMCGTIGNIPTSYLISMSYEEQLLWLCNFLENTIIPNVNANNKAVQELHNYVMNYFVNLDVQEEINNKLDEMAESGELEDIISLYLSMNCIFGYDTISDLKDAINLIDGNIVKTLGNTTYNDGYGSFFKIREIEESDVIDEIHLFALTNFDNLLAEKIIDNNIVNLENAVDNLENSLDSLEENTNTIGIYAPSLANSEGSQMCTLLIGNNKTILFDTGRVNDATSNKNYFENKLNGRKIDYIILSHYHNDHIGGFSSFQSLYSDNIKVYLPMNFDSYYNGSDKAQITQNRTDIIDFLTTNNIEYEEVSTDKVLDIDNFKVELTNSTTQAYTYYLSVVAPSYNSYSMNALVRYGDTKVLFTGDSNEITQNYLLSQNQVEKVNIMTSPHHGYERYANTEYVRKTNPDYEFESLGNSSYTQEQAFYYDYAYKLDNKLSNQYYGNVEYVISKYGVESVNGSFVRGNKYPFKNYTVYVDPSFTGVSYGTSTNPYKTIGQVFMDLPKNLTDINIKLANGTYDDLRFNNISNNISISGISDTPVIIFTQCTIKNCGSINISNVSFTDGTLNVINSKAFFDDCTLACPDTTSGNYCIRSSRSIVEMNNCSFSNCHTGVYAQTTSIYHIIGCTFNCSTYAIYSDGSFVGIKNYTLTSGTLRPTGGGQIVSETAGTTSARPVFNNSNYMRGYTYFDTTLGKPIFYYNQSSQDKWVDATGTIV